MQKENYTASVGNRTRGICLEGKYVATTPRTLVVHKTLFFFSIELTIFLWIHFCWNSSWIHFLMNYNEEFRKKLPFRTKLADLVHKNTVRGIIAVSAFLLIVDSSLITNYFRTKEERVRYLCFIIVFVSNRFIATTSKSSTCWTRKTKKRRGELNSLVR